MELMQLPEVAEEEAVLTVQDRNGAQLVRCAVERAKQTGPLASELAELTNQPPGEYALYTAGENGTRLDPSKTLEDNLQGSREAELRLVGELTGNN